MALARAELSLLAGGRCSHPARSPGRSPRPARSHSAHTVHATAQCRCPRGPARPAALATSACVRTPICWPHAIRSLTSSSSWRSAPDISSRLGFRSGLHRPLTTARDARTRKTLTLMHAWAHPQRGRRPHHQGSIPFHRAPANRGRCYSPGNARQCRAPAPQSKPVAHASRLVTQCAVGGTRTWGESPGRRASSPTTVLPFGPPARADVKKNYSDFSASTGAPSPKAGPDSRRPCPLPNHCTPCLRTATASRTPGPRSATCCQRTCSPE